MQFLIKRRSKKIVADRKVISKEREDLFAGGSLQVVKKCYCERSAAISVSSVYHRHPACGEISSSAKL
ncbi:MAG: hypothetical protein IEMM0003_0938 [bacterium]|nr:MAG: hypothetical protein IEMM0003_0938 [bacterium]